MLTITDTMASHTRLARPFLAVDQHGSLNGRGGLDGGGGVLGRLQAFFFYGYRCRRLGCDAGQGKSVDRLESVSEHGVPYLLQCYHGVASSIVRRPRGPT